MSSCDNCKHSDRQKGSHMGSVEYWCRITSGQKHKDYLCDLYEPESQLAIHSKPTGSAKP